MIFVRKKLKATAQMLRAMTHQKYHVGSSYVTVSMLDENSQYVEVYKIIKY